MRITLNRSTTFKLGRQDERAFRRSRRGRQIWEPVPDGGKFATLFPEYVGTELTITNNGLDLTGDQRRILLVQWLMINGYL